MEHTDWRPVRKFRSPTVEAMSYVHPAMPFFVWLPIAITLLFFSFRNSPIGPLQVIGLAASGLLFWTLAEYVLHRWVFHWEPENERLAQSLRPIHKVHHEVIEWDRLVAHPLFAAPLAAVFFLIFWAALGLARAMPVFAGFTVGYLFYEWVHYLTHYSQLGKGRTGVWFRGLRRRHLQHHFACPTRWYGVTSPLWDYVFRTHVPKGARAMGIDGPRPNQTIF